MPGFVVDTSATILCAHGGMAQSTQPQVRVRINGVPIVTATPVVTVAGCPFTTPGGSPYPCVTGQWISFSMRVQSQGQPLVLADSQSVCTPTGTPLSIISTQTRVKGQ